LGERIELADETIPVFFRRCRQVGDEGLDQVPAGLPDGLGTAEVRGVGLHEVGIEVVLADQEAEPVAETRLAVVVIAVVSSGA
jgi:hypothetical protein